jgi:hypothetical protein
MKFLKYVILVIMAVFLSSGCNRGSNKIPGSVVNIPNTASGETHSDVLPVIKFDKTEHDFGKVIEGEVVTFAFKFRNTGKSDLVIANVSASCGCTATEYPKVPVRPGEENYIKVSFDSHDRAGFQEKTITIAANTQPSISTLNIKAKVIRPEKE